MYRSPCPCRHIVGRRLLGCLQPQHTKCNTSRASLHTGLPEAYSSQPVRLAYALHKPPVQLDGAKAADLTQNAIIFMHGLFGSKQNNRSMSKRLAKDLNRPVYAVDLRNHGDSPHDPHHNYEVLAHDVEAFIHEHKLRNPSLIGHSMGAKAALTLALQSPDLIRDVISVDNAPVTLPLSRNYLGYIEGMMKIEEAKVKSQVEADKILKEFEENSTIRLFLLTNLIRHKASSSLHFRLPLQTLASSLTAVGGFPYSVADEGAHSDVPCFDKPTLLVRGTRGHYIPDGVLPVTRQLFPKTHVVDIDCGHWVISEKPGEFRDAAVKFLSEQLP